MGGIESYKEIILNIFLNTIKIIYLKQNIP